MDYDQPKRDPAQYESDRTAQKKLNLEAYRGQNRLLLFFAPTPQHDTYQQQQAALEGYAAEMQERDLLTFSLFEDARSYAGSVEVGRAEVDRLRADHQVQPRAFTILLIDKDGDEKLRQQHPLQPDALMHLIDGLVTRQQEVEQRENEA